MRKSSAFNKHKLEHSGKRNKKGRGRTNGDYSKDIKEMRAGRRTSLKLGMKHEFGMRKIAPESCRPLQEI